MLHSLNSLLQNESTLQSAQYQDEQYPIYFILSQPRGASSLLQQILISNLDVGYINNFLAKFYKAPLFGLTLENDVLDKEYQSNFISNYGNTVGINEPHEWGWFWKDQLQLEDGEQHTKLQNFSHLKHNLLSITNVRKLPLLLDSSFAISNLLKIKKDFKNIKIINMTRNLYYVSNSFINASIKRYNDINVLYGNTPKNENIQNPIEQIVYRVKKNQDEINEILNSFDEKDILHVDYEDIYLDSFGVVNKFHAFTKNTGIDLNYKEKYLPELTYRNDESFIKPEYKADLDLYYQKYFGNLND